MHQLLSSRQKDNNILRYSTLWCCKKKLRVKLLEKFYMQFKYHHKNKSRNVFVEIQMKQKSNYEFICIEPESKHTTRRHLTYLVWLGMSLKQ